MSDPKPPTGELTLTALLYAGGELGGAERDAFEQRLAGDQAARDALADAVRTTLALGGTADLRPDPAYRAGVRRRLRPSWWRRLTARRSYRGHPLLWVGLGAAAALLLSLSLPGRAERGEQSAGREQRPVVDPAPPAPRPALPEAEVAGIWADLHNHDHLSRACADEHRRRSRAEERRPGHRDDRRFRRVSHPTGKQ